MIVSVEVGIERKGVEEVDDIDGVCSWMNEGETGVNCVV